MVAPHNSAARRDIDLQYQHVDGNPSQKDNLEYGMHREPFALLAAWEGSIQRSVASEVGPGDSLELRETGFIYAAGKRCEQEQT
jgi:hypothetical protein